MAKINIYSDQIENIKFYFRKYQRLLVAFANTDFGRDLLKLPKNINYIWKLTPNSYHVIQGFEGDKVYIKGFFYCKYHMFCPQTLYIALLGMDIAKENSVASLVHFLGVLPDPKRFPQLLFITTSFFTGAGDGECVHSPGGTTNWATTIGASASSAANATNTTTTVGQAEWDGATSYNCGRGFLPADTSGLTADATLASGFLNVTGSTVRNAGGDTIYLEQTTQASTTTVGTDDYDQVGSIKTGGSSAMSNFSGGGATSINLNATSLGWVNKTGITKIGLKLGRDIDNIDPGFNPGDDLLIINTSENASGKPYYSFTYTLPAILDLTSKSW